ncbi:WYL domain-containing protein [Psychrosphaera aestuarii]|uniref:WYL domain-containing protein n=1 Tax=Psychrosphaera aestuarii TaxID=1266052 RepID=UPI001B333737|nr:WYL domain-containing protein [Psychrosphaera aestuarii]
MIKHPAHCQINSIILNESEFVFKDSNPNTFNEALSKLSHAQKQRLAFIDFSLFFKGHLCRNDLIQQFEVGLSAATRDFTLYKEFGSNNLYYDNQVKRYFQADTFKPLFEHDARRTLIKLANQISDGFDAISNTPFPVEQPSYLNFPNINVIARLVQAMLNGNVVNIIYTSLSSGSNARDVVPHSIIDNGLRWHVRAFDRKSQSFRDFVLTRISKVSIRSNQTMQSERKASDIQWQQILDLEIVPHPNNVQHTTAIEMDYGMTDGRLNLKVRAAMAGYLLRRWNVDCTNNASLSSPEYQLHLHNRSSLNGVAQLAIAPGYSN